MPKDIIFTFFYMYNNSKFQTMTHSFNQRLKQYCLSKNSRLCIGLDIDPDRMPNTFAKTIDGMESFAISVIDATIDICPVYKPNLAFFERFGSKGLAVFEKLVKYIDNRAIIIADAKRGDIGNTAKQYAKAFFEGMGCDAVTVAPYMGRDSIEPFCEDEKYGVFVLGLTSNKGAYDFQYKQSNGTTLYEDVIKLVVELNSKQNMGLVVGATKPDQMSQIRSKSKGLSWLIPGIGAQGGDLQTSIEIGNQNGVGIVNVSRGILYPEDGTIESIRKLAKNYTHKIQEYV